MAATLHDPITIRETQELLTLAGIAVPIDGADGPKTRFATVAHGRVCPEPLGTVFAALAARGHPPITVAPGDTLSGVVLAVARWYLASGVREVGGNNLGPWVRWFLGADGPGCEWCAGFAWCTVIPEAEAILNAARDAAGLDPIRVAAALRSASCTLVHGKAQAAGRLVTDLARVRPGMGMLWPRDGAWHHTGIVEVVEPGSPLILTIEGNALDESDRGRSDRVARHVRDAVALGLAFVDLDR